MQTKMELFIDPSQRRGVADALFEQLREAIVNGRLRAGDQVPPSRDLAGELGISRHTVTTVYGRLVAEGFLEGHAGGGTRVSPMALGPLRRERPTELRPLPQTTVDFVTYPPSDSGFDLRIGLPDRTLFPVTVWRRCVVSALQVAPTAGGQPAGNVDLRRTLAHWVGRSRGIDVDAEDLVVTSGAQHAVDLVSRALVRPGEKVAFEEPGYAPIRHLLEASGFRVVPVPVDVDGIVVEAIPTDVRLVYVTPSHQSPTGATMSLPRRRALLELADRHQMAVVEDDYDSEYRHSDRPLEPLFRLDRAGRVVYVGTFSKTLSPTLRLGFVALPSSLTDAVVKLAELAGAYPAAAMQRAMYHFVVDGHLERHLRKARRVYGERYAIVEKFVGEMVADGLLLPGPTSNAGLHVAARLAAGARERDVVDEARRRDVALTALANSWMGPARWDGLLLGFGRARPDDLAKGLAVVREILAAIIRGRR
jgi:GntR family transcriptional regulator/MocR family aminotransferase